MLDTAYERPKDIPVKDIAIAASIILPRLFCEEPYSLQDASVYSSIFHRSFEDFLDREILTYAGVIILDIPDNLIHEELKYRFATLYFLHTRHNCKLRRGIAQKYNMELLDDWLYELLKVAARKIYKKWQEQKNLVPDKENFFVFFKKLSFVLYDHNVQYVWNGSDYHENQHDCVQIRLSIARFEDEHLDYKQLINSLLTKKRNGIADFENTAIFWRHVMKIRRGADTYRFEENCVSNVDLLLFCLSLAADDKVYQLLLKKLDQEKKRSHLKQRKFKFPDIKKAEVEFLRERLCYAGENLRLALEHSDAFNKYSIPRRILFDINLCLLQKGLHPIIPLTGTEEITAIKDEVAQATLKQFYNEGTMSDGNTRVQALLLKKV